MKARELKIKQLFQKTEVISRALEIAEDETHILQRCARDILDEVGDILHDDLRFKNRIINKALIKPEFKEKIETEFLTLIIRRYNIV